jgi:hypothetical protein
MENSERGKIDVKENALFEDTCRELQAHPSLGATYQNEAHLRREVFKVIDGYINDKHLPLTVRDTNVESINAFGRGKSPDIMIKFQEKRFIAIEVKYRDTSEWVLSIGIGQAVTYSVKYPYGILFIRDTYDKDPAVKHDFDDRIKSSLMRYYRIRLIIRYNYSS